MGLASADQQKQLCFVTLELKVKCVIFLNNDTLNNNCLLLLFFFRAALQQNRVLFASSNHYLPVITVYINKSDLPVITVYVNKGDLTLSPNQKYNFFLLSAVGQTQNIVPHCPRFLSFYFCDNSLCTVHTLKSITVDYI